jgi:hypothetical protein
LLGLAACVYPATLVWIAPFNNCDPARGVIVSFHRQFGWGDSYETHSFGVSRVGVVGYFGVRSRPRATLLFQGRTDD